MAGGDRLARVESERNVAGDEQGGFRDVAREQLSNRVETERINTQILISHTCGAFRLAVVVAFFRGFTAAGWRWRWLVERHALRRFSANSMQPCATGLGSA